MSGAWYMARERFGALLMLIGEAPGEQEALQGRPFVGRAGKNLEAFLALAGLSREALYITNAVKFRPTKLSASGRVTNGRPRGKRSRSCAPGCCARSRWCARGASRRWETCPYRR